MTDEHNAQVEPNVRVTDEMLTAFRVAFDKETKRNNALDYNGSIKAGIEAALSSAPAPPVDGKVEPVKVKPLVWVDTLHDDHPGGATSKAETPFGEYAITSWSTGEWRTMYGPARGWEGRGTKEELQAAAQADYEQRILSALASPPARHSDEEVERLRDALTPFADIADFMDSETTGFAMTDELSLICRGDDGAESALFHDFKVSDFYDARAALQPDAQGGGE